MWRIIVGLVGLVAWLVPVPAGGSGADREGATAEAVSVCPSGVPEPTELRPAARRDAPSPAPHDVDHAATSGVFLGVGHLRLAPDAGLSPWDWQLEVRLPLFSEPDGMHSGWIADGWVELGGGGADRARPVGGLVETGYEQVSLPVLAKREDGWLEVRYGSGPSEAGWVHACQLPPAVVYEGWQGLLLRDDISPLFFRTEVPHALREGPGTESRRITWVPSGPGDYDLEPLEVRGEWMRVRLEIPSDYCVGPEGVQTTEWEGWVRWWGPEIGPWVWFYTRGC